MVKSREFHWRKGAPLTWSKKPWTGEDIMAVLFLAIFATTIIAATLLAPFA